MRHLRSVLTLMAVLAALGLVSGCTEPVTDAEVASNWPDPADRPLAAAVAAGDLEQITGLIRAGADPDVTGAGGITMLEWSLDVADVDVLVALLDAGADPDIRGATGATALKQACLGPSAPIFEALISAGADPSLADTNNDGPIHTCARVNAGALVLRMLELGVDPMTRSGSGATFQDYYFGYDRAVLNERALGERDAVIAWLEDHDVPVVPEAYD